MRLLLLLPLLLSSIRCQCPHMGGGRVSPPSAPPHSSIQSTFLYKSNVSPSPFALLVTTILKRIKEDLRDKANLSLDNENIHCEEGTNQPPCTDYQGVNSFNLFILEDSRNGARVYSLEEELNGQEETRIEAAILDALSRHSKRDLTVHSSPKTEKIVGFVRELTTEELEEMGRVGGAKNRKKEKMRGVIPSPLLIHPIDHNIIQMRSTKDIDISTKNVREISSNEEVDRILEEKTHLFILFWSNTDIVSTHSLALFANSSLLLPSYQDTVLAHVPCHIHTQFCAGLKSRDLHMVVGYSNGAKVSTLSEMENAQLYRDWMEIVRTGPIRELKGVEEVKETKKGFVDGRRRGAVTIGTFPSREDMTFRHFQMAADKVFGQYYLFYSIKEGLPSIQTYRHGETIYRRQGHVDEFDPHSIARFIITSSQPTIMSISTGFSSDYLLRNTHPLLLLISPSSFDTSNLSRFSFHYSTSFIVAHLDNSIPESFSVLKDLFIESTEPQLIIFDKTKVWHMELTESNTEEEILQWTEAIVETEPDLVLSPLGVHPLRILQISAINRIFGRQEIDLPEDPSLFSPLPSIDMLHSLKDSQSSSGCPFMNGGSSAPSHHEEL